MIEGGGGGSTPEPDWSLIYADELEVSRAREYWRGLIGELRDTEKFANANLHSVKRVVGAYLLVDRAMEKVAEMGAVMKGKRGGLIANPWVDVLKDANAIASSLEAELTITPRRRNNGGKVQRQKKTFSASDAYLKPVAR